MTNTLTRGTAAAILALSLCAIAHAAKWNRVAYDDAGAVNKQPHLVDGGNWKFNNPGDANEAARTAAFGERLEFAYAGLNPKAAYKVRLRFFSDDPREVRVTAGGAALLKSIAIETARVAEREAEIPPAAYVAGKLALAIERINGPNAVVSEVEVLSTDPAPLGTPPIPDVVLPRLSPRPVAVAGTTMASVDLAGAWRFNPAPPADFALAATESGDGWADIQVPGEWVMQGFKVAPGKAAGYRRTFAVPKDWNGKRVKLRCDGVYSVAKVWINGKEAGGHLGGFTPFELDITKLVKLDGENTIALAVKNESLADSLASGTKYAAHPLGGITRKIRMFALPETHLSKLHVATTFDRDFRDATLELDTAVEGEGAELALSLTAPDGREVMLTPARAKPGQVSIPVANPAKWDNEHPSLYALAVRVEVGGKTVETVVQKIGFRQVEVRGNQVFVNNVPVKLRGVCRHEVHPLRGRSNAPENWRKDAELFRAGNCNYIRTSHYPACEEFVDACDELGLFVELEAPFCWAHETRLSPAQIPDTVTRQELETLENYRNHPSIIQWSLGNESYNWSYFLPAAKLLKKLDPSRPFLLSTAPDLGEQDHGFCPLNSRHYPGPGGPAAYAKNPRPTTFDEYMHLNSYNRRELVSDPGLRDLWGQGMEVQWDKMRSAQGCLGGAIWAAIDDTFFLPNGDTVGYGTWGPIDGWRRPKPEYWHMKKAYSPLRLRETSVAVPAAGQPARLQVENRHSFTDLAELRFDWKLGNQSGTAKATAAPGAAGVLEIPLSGDKLNGQLLEIRAVSPLGFMVDTWQVSIGADPRTALPVVTAKAANVKLEKTATAFIVRGADYTAAVDAKTGALSITGKDGKPVLLSGPELLVLSLNGDNGGGTQMFGKEKDTAPFTDTCSDWTATAVSVVEAADGVEAKISGGYTQATGEYTLSFANDGTITIKYAFTVTAKGRCDPRQIGVVFGLSGDCQTLAWRRQSQWSAYPDDHIGRAVGTATAFVEGVPFAGLAGPRMKPSWPWSQDGNKYGTNDFRSTKRNIFEASLTAADGRGIRILSDGKQHIRGWVAGDTVRLLVAEYTNEGAPPFFNEHTVPHRPLNPGDKAEGAVRLEIR